MCTVAAGTPAAARGMIHQDKHEARPPRNGEIVQRFPIRQRLAGMVQRRFHVDDRLADRPTIP
jgi:hypothetical protein